MIAGIVSANLEPIIRISVLDSRGQTHERDAILDTGFNGWLCLPAEFIAMLGLNWQRVGTAILADGSQTIFDVYTEVVRRAVNVARAQIFGRSEGSRIRVQFHPPDDPIVLPIDPSQIEDAVLNLIINAIEDDGCVDVRILRAPPDETDDELDEVMIEVSDKGPGISEENLSRIFNPFFTTTKGGTGLGLPAVRRIVRAHSGRVGVKSVLGEGSTFTIHLPINDAET